VGHIRGGGSEIFLLLHNSLFLWKIPFVPLPHMSLKTIAPIAIDFIDLSEKYSNQKAEEGFAAICELRCWKAVRRSETAKGGCTAT